MCCAWSATASGRSCVSTGGAANCRSAVRTGGGRTRLELTAHPRHRRRDPRQCLDRPLLRRDARALRAGLATRLVVVGGTGVVGASCALMRSVHAAQSRPWRAGREGEFPAPRGRFGGGEQRRSAQRRRHLCNHRPGRSAETRSASRLGEKLRRGQGPAPDFPWRRGAAVPIGHLRATLTGELAARPTTPSRTALRRSPRTVAVRRGLLSQPSRGPRRMYTA